MSGIIGLIGERNAGQKLYAALYALQHRGQDAAGILSYNFSRAQFHLEKDYGLVGDVFKPHRLARLKGSMALGHTRYSLSDGTDQGELQPLVLSYPYGIGMVHDGNVTNYDEIVDFLTHSKHRRPFGFNDLELLLHLTADGLAAGNPAGDLVHNLAVAVRQVQRRARGAYSVVAMLADRGLFAFCDPHGIRPLLIGRKRRENGQTSYCFASEEQAFFGLGFEYWRDMAPGEFAFVDRELHFHASVLEQTASHPCMFEWIYLAGPETQWHGRSVYEVRLRLGELLGRLCQARGFDVDVVAPVPDTSRPAACRLAEVLQVPYREVLIKNRYVQRSFIERQAELRRAIVGLKLAPVVSEIRGRSILLVDDSVVRGTTANRIVALLRQAGAGKIYFASTSPPVRHACFYGIDFPREQELLGNGRTEAQMQEALGVDGLVFLPQEQLFDALGVPSLCMACVSGNYPVPVDADDFLGSRRFQADAPAAGDDADSADSNPSQPPASGADAA
ncbi:MAG: amidophosphoribosyltransferase [Ottowia sp.]|nr:amidophosphoribosyltransferase [Ottowia sp.]